jgi:hypothetical protein
VQILDLEDERALSAAVNAHVHEGLNGAGFDRLWAEHD